MFLNVIMPIVWRGNMRFIAMHSDFIKVEPRQKAIKNAEENPANVDMEECLVVFTAVEKGDTINLVERYVKEIENIAEQVKTKRVMLYPYVHLTSNPSNPSLALDVLKGAELALANKGYDVKRAPFGWYKSFSIKVKGHPLSELSREIKPTEVKEENISQSLKKEEKLKSTFYILTTDGNLVPVYEFDYTGHENLKKFMIYETKKVRAYERAPPHIKLMKEHEFVDYEPGTDPGNFRWYPKGRLIKKLLEKWITDFCIDYGAMEVETPLMYDYEHPSLKKYLNRFPARQYIVKSDDKEYFLRFAACFGQFLIMHDMTISYKHLPLKLYELTRYSFRRELSGELAGLKRLRAFTMPDMHTLTENIDQAKDEFEKQLEKGMEWLRSVGLLDWTEVGFRIVKDFYEENKEWYKRLVKKIGKPILVEMFDERYAYFITKFEFNFVDAMDKASALTTVQIDVENANTYDIAYVSRDGSKKRPYILHASLSGSLERVIYALLEKEAIKIEKGKKAMLPLWLSPTQIRFIPVSNEKHLSYIKDLIKQINANVRFDVDDRDETLQRKIRSAEKEWIPYIAVIGDKEIKSGTISVSIRETGERKTMKLDELISLIVDKTKDMPFEQLSLPTFLSMRPTFRQSL